MIDFLKEAYAVFPLFTTIMMWATAGAAWSISWWIFWRAVRQANCIEK